MIASVTSRIRFLCGPSDSRPSTGVATAPTSRFTVNVHCAALTETPNSAAIVGTSSRPSELMIAAASAA